MLKREENIRIYIRCLSIIGCLLTIIILFYAGNEDYILSPEKLNKTIKTAGVAAPLLFIVLQIVQVVFPIIPGGIGCAAGVLIFGPWYGFLYNYIGICIGSIINFLLARKYGKFLVRAFVKESIYNKYIEWTYKEKSFAKLFAIAIFLPVAPDDFLCMIAGLTNMKLKTFTKIIVAAKPVSIFTYSISLTFGLQYFAQFLQM